MIGNASDPYVIASIGAIEQESAVVWNTLEPLFGETLELGPIVFEEAISRDLKLRVLDKNRITSDAPLGEVSIPLVPFLEFEVLERTVALSTQGTITVRLTFLQSPEDPAAVTPDLPPPVDLPQG